MAAQLKFQGIPRKFLSSGKIGKIRICLQSKMLNSLERSGYLLQSFGERLFKQ